MERWRGKRRGRVSGRVFGGPGVGRIGGICGPLLLLLDFVFFVFYLGVCAGGRKGVVVVVGNEVRVK